ncbi:MULTISPECIES: MBL fold metallo-hydrolase [Chryseobacterium]|uniref:Hydroxyacylglutathione hydrolase n=1 Tax=Chryseobacterium camelliae TaxID=1265445 RepID=A0ABU0TK64_9FLAO|nr:MULTISPECIES: MBL fold metallo-hydrolase [Chryseobacterium]MDT3408707.1 hydroxyacylglutathione hydrolase [Pseudacidovorax intermedius]MDQ1097440.1 hydroxyacylglutathione hydrolase [Chryseobacterium camelliae]MDQ1101368.1 hydroxyacylglutathione hydrolase [Chryseobacterium sp. SORGH_AS_1048]MDR6084813.1 hydroxyacylglutathione hydrolase [Chryseobacterium sp. SORGH_AS_0909]MDR6129161.1 hydroxyacylglutathione hydrolase [Chryseobacterium sp. SORGH_AS_1175]
MLQIQGFVFNFAGENTYILYNEHKNAWLIDPGNSNEQETKAIENFISENGLTIRKILLTHAHIDHVLGLQWAFDTFKVPVVIHQQDKEILDMFQISGMRFGMNLNHIKVDLEYINEGDELDLDGEAFIVYHVPGHSPGSIVYHNKNQKFMISGDVLFEGSIGRTDLYKGNYEQLISGIKNKLFILDDETQVFSGHGNPTTIGFEKQYNPFLQ